MLCGMCNASLTSVAVDGRSANRLVTAKIKLRSTFTPTSCTSTCRNLVGEKKGMMEWEKGKRERGRRKKREKSWCKENLQKTFTQHAQTINKPHCSEKKAGLDAMQSHQVRSNQYQPYQLHGVTVKWRFINCMG